LLLLLEHGLAERFLEPDLAESRLGGSNQPALAALGSEVPQVRVDDHLTLPPTPLARPDDTPHLPGPAFATPVWCGA
jgi:hypothetical protein